MTVSEIIETNSSRVEDSIGQVNDTSSLLEKIEVGTSDIMKSSELIYVNSSEQSEGINMIGSAMKDLEKGMAVNSNAVDDVGMSTVQMESQCQILDRVVGNLEGLITGKSSEKKSFRKAA